MNSHDFNKAAMGILMFMLLAIGVSNLTEVVFEQEPLEANAYPIDTASVASASSADVATENGPSIAELLQTASVEKGESVFKKCAACHTPDNGGANKIGPNLWNVVGRNVASKADYDYSPAMHDHGGTWSYEALDQYLTSPKDYVPKNKMAFAGIKKDTDRASVIMYLRSLSDTPHELPTVEVAEAPAEEAAAPAEATAPDPM
ncbi:MAG: cytochrome c family protein [Kordiimonadaceae bacterium]|nr:cytochrome c family protein [Kordiimonadaceae bacterium]